MFDMAALFTEHVVYSERTCLLNRTKGPTHLHASHLLAAHARGAIVLLPPKEVGQIRQVHSSRDDISVPPVARERPLSRIHPCMYGRLYLSIQETFAIPAHGKISENQDLLLPHTVSACIMHEH